MGFKVGDHVQVTDEMRETVGEPASGYIVEVDSARNRFKVKMDWKKTNCALWFSYYELRQDGLWKAVLVGFVLTVISVAIATMWFFYVFGK